MADEEKQRFAFGENWQDFLRILSDEHIREAEKSLSIFLDTHNLNQKRFLISAGDRAFTVLLSSNWMDQQVSMTILMDFRFQRNRTCFSR